ncbi:MAG: CRISPR-associated protein Cas4 [Candidatus Latescibacterota bacterium]
MSWPKARSPGYAESDLLPLSALQHLLFCERQCALIHVERAWAENRLTAEGRLLHERVHEAGDESRGDLRVVRGLPLRSLNLGLYGVADVVEFHRSEGAGTRLPGAAGTWQAVPVEYKRGHPKVEDCDRVQLCAQALCLEEMLGLTVAAGSLFYGQPRRREEVVFGAELRSLVQATAARLHRLLASGTTPPARYEARCRSCSLLEACLPQRVERRGSASEYVKVAFAGEPEPNAGRGEGCS